MTIPRLDLDGVAVSEVVERIKCELAISLPDIRGEYNPARPYHWLKGWTAKVDLDLQTTETGVVTPSATYLDPPANFTLGVGGQLKTEAYRNDGISFTLSIDELMDLAVAEQCNFSRGLGLLGHLGLKEWVDSALGPVDAKVLTIGFHQAPGKNAQLLAPVEKTSSPQKRSESASADKAVREKTPQDKLDDVFVKIENKLLLAETLTETARIAASNARKTAVGRRMDETFRYAKAAGEKAQSSELEVESAKVLIWQAKKDFIDLLPPWKKDSDSDNLKRLAKINSRMKDVTEQTSAARNAAVAAWELLPRDAPLDSISHTAKFTMNASLNATPNWTLVRFRGPGLANPFASIQRQRIHEMVIVLGAPNTPGGKDISEEQKRQLLNAKINSRGFIVLQQ